MTETSEKLKIELSQLSAKERAEIAYFLIHSLDDDVENTWDIELTQRMQAVQNGTAPGQPAHQVFTQLREKSS